MQQRHDLHWKQCIELHGSATWQNEWHLFERRCDLWCRSGVSSDNPTFSITHRHLHQHYFPHDQSDQSSISELCSSVDRSLPSEEKAAIKNCGRCRWIKHGEQWARRCAYTDSQVVIRSWLCEGPINPANEKFSLSCSLCQAFSKMNPGQARGHEFSSKHVQIEDLLRHVGQSKGKQLSKTHQRAVQYALALSAKKAEDGGSGSGLPRAPYQVPLSFEVLHTPIGAVQGLRRLPAGPKQWIDPFQDHGVCRQALWLCDVATQIILNLKCLCGTLLKVNTPWSQRLLQEAFQPESLILLALVAELSGAAMRFVRKLDRGPAFAAAQVGQAVLDLEQELDNFFGFRGPQGSLREPLVLNPDFSTGYLQILQKEHLVSAFNFSYGSWCLCGASLGRMCWNTGRSEHDWTAACP
eukprot:s1367_g11.t1